MAVLTQTSCLLAVFTPCQDRNHSSVTEPSQLCRYRSATSRPPRTTPNTPIAAAGLYKPANFGWEGSGAVRPLTRISPKGRSAACHQRRSQKWRRARCPKAVNTSGKERGGAVRLIEVPRKVALTQGINEMKKNTLKHTKNYLKCLEWKQEVTHGTRQGKKTREKREPGGENKQMSSFPHFFAKKKSSGSGRSR